MKHVCGELHSWGQTDGRRGQRERLGAEGLSAARFLLAALVLFRCGVQAQPMAPPGSSCLETLKGRRGTVRANTLEMHPCDTHLAMTHKG